MSTNNGHLDTVAQVLSQLPVPAGWARTTIGEIGQVRLGRQRSPKNRSKDHPTKYLRAANIKWEGLDLSDVLDMDFRPEERDVYRLRPGDVLLSEASGSASEVGKPAIWNGEIDDCCFQNTVIRFRPGAVTPKFALLAFSHFARSGIFSQVSKGVGIHHLSADRFSVLPFLLPPSAEQERIVAKADELLSDLDAGVDALKRAQANLKRYRSAVLKDAVEGRLTEFWRTENKPSETRRDLLERILKQRRRKWEDEQRAAFAAAAKAPPKNWQAKYKEPVAPDTADLPSLPEGWCWVSLESLADVTGGLTKDKKRATEAGVREVPYLRVANVQRGFLDLREVKLIHASDQDVESLRLQPGDVLFTEGGDRDKLGRGWVWSGELAECIHQNHVFRARLLVADMQPKFLSIHGNTFGQEWFTKAGKQTTNLASINLGMLRRFPVPVPSPEEQQQIVSDVEDLLSTIGKAEEEVSRGLARAARLRQSILRDAFEGRLVVQDPADEPATELLARIQSRRRVADESPTVARKPRKVPKEITYRRAAIVAYTVEHLGKSKSFGRTQLEKTLYVAQTHEGVDLQLEFRRFAAGPFDEAIYKLEATAKKNKWFSTKDRDNYGVTYHPADKSSTLAEHAIEFLGERRTNFDRLLVYVAEMNMKESELFATAYAAWNDLLIDGKQPDDDAIVAEFYAWDESKKDFSRSDILARLKWMRQQGYVPTGKGERTQPRGKKTKLPSNREKGTAPR